MRERIRRIHRGLAKVLTAAMLMETVFTGTLPAYAEPAEEIAYGEAETAELSAEETEAAAVLEEVLPEEAAEPETAPEEIGAGEEISPVGDIAPTKLGIRFLNWKGGIISTMACCFLENPDTTRNADKVEPLFTPSNTTNKNVSYSSSDETVLTVSSDGKLITHGKVGNSVITVTSQADSSLSVSCNLRVYKNTDLTEISLRDMQDTYTPITQKWLSPGYSFTLVARDTGGNTVSASYVSTDPGIVSVDAAGKVTALGDIGQAEILATCNDDPDLTARCLVKISARLKGIELIPSSLVIKPGDTFQLSANFLPLGISPVELEWASTDPRVATVSPNGLVTARSKGSCEIAARTVRDTFGARCKVRVLDRVITAPEEFQLVSLTPHSHSVDVQFTTVSPDLFYYDYHPDLGGRKAKKAKYQVQKRSLFMSLEDPKGEGEKIDPNAGFGVLSMNRSGSRIFIGEPLSISDNKNGTWTVTARFGNAVYNGKSENDYEILDASTSYRYALFFDNEGVDYDSRKNITEPRYHSTTAERVITYLTGIDSFTTQEKYASAARINDLQVESGYSGVDVSFEVKDEGIEPPLQRFASATADGTGLSGRASLQEDGRYHLSFSTGKRAVDIRAGIEVMHNGERVRREESAEQGEAVKLETSSVRANIYKYSSEDDGKGSRVKVVLYGAKDFDINGGLSIAGRTHTSGLVEYDPETGYREDMGYEDFSESFEKKADGSAVAEFTIDAPGVDEDDNGRPIRRSRTFYFNIVTTDDFASDEEVTSYVLWSSGWKTAGSGIAENLVRSISLNKTSLTMNVAGEENLSILNLEADEKADKTLLWSSSNESIVSITETGSDGAKLLALHPGKARITCASRDGNASAFCDVVVSGQQSEISNIRLEMKKITMTEGDSQYITAVVAPFILTEGVTVTWKSSDESVVRVTSGAGTLQSMLRAKVAAQDTGRDNKAVLTVTATAGEKTVSDSCTVFVLDAGEGALPGASGVQAALLDSGYYRSEEDFYYTGEAITPKAQVCFGRKLLREGTDYTLSYKNNVKPKQKPRKRYKDEDGNWYWDDEGPTYLTNSEVKITFAGDYKGTAPKTLPFRIIGRPLDDAAPDGGERGDFTAPKSIALAYKPSGQRPVPELYLNGKALRNGTDFTVSYGEDEKSLTESGSITLSGKGCFTGSLEIPCTILGEGDSTVLMSSVIIGEKKLAYNGKKVEKTDITVINKNNSTVPGDAYSISSCFCNGKAVLTLTGVESKGYAGSKIFLLPLEGASLADLFEFSNAWQDNMVWSAKRPMTQSGNALVSKKDNKTPAVEGRDYRVTYKNNGKVGKATAIYTGMGSCSGKITKTFNITPCSVITVDQITQAPMMKGGSMPELTVRDAEGSILTLKQDYTVKYTDNKTVGGTAKAVVTGKGNYKGLTAETSFTVTKGQLSELMIDVPDVKYNKKPDKYQSKPMVLDQNGKALKAGTDYEIGTPTYSEALKAKDGGAPVPGTVITVTLTGKGDYEGVCTESYRVMNANAMITKATMKIRKQSWSGKAVVLTNNAFSGSFLKNGKVKNYLDLGTDFVVTGYTNNLRPGTATVYVKGIGRYGGTRKMTFRIGK